MANPMNGYNPPPPQNPNAPIPPQSRDDRMEAMRQELAMRQNMQYNPWAYQGYPYNPTPINQYNQTPINPQDYQPQNPQPAPNPIPEPQKPNEYLQGYPIEGTDQLREARVGLDGRVSLFPFFSENSIYTKQTNLDGLPVYSRYILDEEFKMEEVSESPSTNSNGFSELNPILKEMKDLQAEMREELKALREERTNASKISSDESTPTTAGSSKANNSTSNVKRSGSNATSTAANEPKPADAGSTGASVPDAKG